MGGGGAGVLRRASRRGRGGYRGWGPFGPDRLITKSHKNVVFEFDGRPALALYKQYLGEYAAGLPAAGLMFPLELQTEGGRVLRALLAVDEKEQSITFAGNMPMGSSARFMVGHIEDLIDGAVAAANAGAAKLGEPAAFSLVVSCNARRAVLKQRVDEEVEAVREVFGPGTALAGFYSYGEIGPAREGSGAQLHNETMTITTFRER
ncbi:MAG TPA: FIST C-terminal domain-containing protein [Opitutus sp.]|nr:FIST C-terminal domain-containing protein [Opitutus sp.]